MFACCFCLMFSAETSATGRAGGANTGGASVAVPAPTLVADKWGQH